MAFVASRTSQKKQHFSLILILCGTRNWPSAQGPRDGTQYVSRVPPSSSGAVRCSTRKRWLTSDLTRGIDHEGRSTASGTDGSRRPTPASCVFL